MAISYNKKQLDSFFVGEGELYEHDNDLGRILTYIYQGNPLKFEIMIHMDNDYVGISGDTERPFGGDSLFEFYVPADNIKFYDFGGYDKESPMLSFTYGLKDDPHYKTMGLHRSPNQKLKVWPVYAFPKGHIGHPTA
ncbi:MAG: hypothetical protein P1U89_23415 [Verrucomicrobiales bacterium]|nr:hypothetical protein [Verrucomicrobiales bacterium]